MYKLEDEIVSGFSEIPVLRVGTGDPGDTERRQITLPNAYRQDDGRVDLLPLASATINLAEKFDVPMQITLHKSPDAYGFGPRYDTFETVYRHEMRDEPQLMQAFSWGWPQLLAMAEHLHHSGHEIEAAQGLAANSVTPLHIRPGQLLTGVVDLVRAGFIESEAQADRMIEKSLEKYPDAKGAGLLRHIVPHLYDAGSEVVDLLFVDNIKRTVDLQRVIGAFTTMIACNRDRVCRADRMERNLRDEGFPMEQFFKLDNMRHIDAVKRQQHIEQAFRALVFQELPIRDQASKLVLPAAS